MKGRILYLDDSVIELELIKHILNYKSDTYETVYFTDPAMGIREIENREFDVIILDYQLPNITGLEIIDKIKLTEKNENTPVIMLTGEGDENIAVSAMKKGAFDYFVKGNIDHSSFLRTIRYALEKKSLESRQRQMAKERKGMQIKMISQSRLASLGEMATGAAHEIFQPLSVIRGNIELLTMDIEEGVYNPKEWKQIIPILYKSIDRIQMIVDHLKVFGKPKEGEKQYISLKDLAKNVLFFWEKKIQRANVQFIKKCSGKFPDLYVEKGEMEQVFINILQNSLDAFEEKNENKIIEMTVSGVDDSGKMQVIIQDNGRGIPKENLSRVFEPFFTTKEGNQGMGLGLSVAYATVNHYNGSIEIDSKENEYTRVTIRLSDREMIK